MGKKIINAFGFLTIIKIPESITVEKKDISGSLVYFPLVGFVMGIIISLSFFVMDLFLPVLVTVLLVLIIEVFLTGAAHIDGLADTFDGIFSGKSRKDKILEIMKKSDVGVFGILSIIFLVIIKAALIYYLFNSSFKGPLPENISIFYFYATLLFMPAFGRWSMTYLLASYNSARTGSSLAKIFTESKQRSKYFTVSTVYLFIVYTVLIITIWYLVTLLNGRIIGLLPVIAGVLIVIAFSILMIIFLGWFFTRRIGGVTGDIVGGTSEIMEVFFLLMSYLVLNYLWY